MSEPLDLLRATVEEMLIAAGFTVLDIVTRDLSIEDGETEWIVLPERSGKWWYLNLCNNLGPLLMQKPERAKALISSEIASLRKQFDRA